MTVRAVELFPDPSSIRDVQLNFPDGLASPCMLEGLRDVLRSGNSNAADRKFVAEEYYGKEDESATETITLHCASAALGRCSAKLVTLAENHGCRIPKSSSFDPRKVEELECPMRQHLDGLGSGALGL